MKEMPYLRPYSATDVELHAAYHRIDHDDYDLYRTEKRNLRRRAESNRGIHMNAREIDVVIQKCMKNAAIQTFEIELQRKHKRFYVSRDDLIGIFVTNLRREMAVLGGCFSTLRDWARHVCKTSLWAHVCKVDVSKDQYAWLCKFDTRDGGLWQMDQHKAATIAEEALLEAKNMPAVDMVSGSVTCAFGDLQQQIIAAGEVVKRATALASQATVISGELCELAESLNEE